MDLVKKYPELAKFVDNKDGVLSIDLESDGVQDVLQKYEADINWKRGMCSKTNSIPKYITVIQYDKDMNVIQTFHSYKEIKDCGYRIGKIRTSALNNNIYKNSYWFIEE
jgi:hypothetical protein